MIRYYNPQTSCIELVFIPLYHLVVTQPSFSNAPPPLIIRFDTLRGLIPTSILSTGPRRNGGTGRGLSRSRKREPRHDKEICIKAWFLFFFLVYRRPARPARPGGCRIVVFLGNLLPLPGLPGCLSTRPPYCRISAWDGGMVLEGKGVRGDGRESGDG